MISFINFLKALSAIKKFLVLISLDFFVFIVSLWLAVALRVGILDPLIYQMESSIISLKAFPYLPILSDMFWLFIVSPITGISIMYSLGVYSRISRYVDLTYISRLSKAVLIYSLFFGLIVLLIEIPEFPRSSLIINFFTTLFSFLILRLFISLVINFNPRPKIASKNVLIYGAGDAGIQLGKIINSEKIYHLCAYSDDKNSLHDRFIFDVPVIPPSKIKDEIGNLDITDIYIAIPSLTQKGRKKIFDRLAGLPVNIMTLPSLNELTSGKVLLEDIQELNIDDLLPRVATNPNFDLLKDITSKQSIMVTGAGGSIGSEICNQIIRLNPHTIILFERNEFSLHEVQRKLEIFISRQNEKNDLKVGSLPKIIPILGSVLDYQRVLEVVEKFNPKIIYHAAAYKHVPIVEQNIYEGVLNNLFGTICIAMAAIKLKIPNFVFISTDKAVRPTNVMGASKRLAEIFLQAASSKDKLTFNNFGINEKNLKNITCFSIVRFGNVLGSSGSVVPIFREQIKKQKTITLTDPAITRYFMSISEAAQLVIQTGSIARSLHDKNNSKNSKIRLSEAEIFLLDMGEPVKIIDLARRMITLSGFQEKTKDNPFGDIEIIISGLRPGEKLYEELLISGNAVSTEHPKIKRAKEEYSTWEQFTNSLLELSNLLKTNDKKNIIQFLKDNVKGYKPGVNIVDLIHQKNS